MTSAIFPGRRRKQPSARVELRIRRRSRELRPEPAELRGLLFRELAMIDSPGVPDQAGPPPRVAGGPWVRHAICRSWPATLSHRHEFQARRGPVESKQAGIGTFFRGTRTARICYDTAAVRKLPHGRIGPLAIRVRGPACAQHRHRMHECPTMPSLIRFLSFLGLLAALAYVVMFALVSVVEPTQREFIVTIPQDHMGKKKIAGTAAPRHNAKPVAEDPAAASRAESFVAGARGLANTAVTQSHLPAVARASPAGEAATVGRFFADCACCR